MLKKVLPLILLFSGFHANASLITNGGFNSGFTGWNVGVDPAVADGGRPYQIDTGGDGWDIVGGRAVNGFDGGVIDCVLCDLTFFLEQDFSYTDTLVSAQLMFSYEITQAPVYDRDGLGADDPDRIFSVNFLDSGDNFLATVFEDRKTIKGTGPTSSTAPVNNNPTPWTTISVDVTSILQNYADETLTLSFQELIPQYFTGPSRFYIDDISLRVETTTPVPEPSALALLGLGLAGLGVARRLKQKA